MLCIEQEVLVSGQYNITLENKYVNNQNEGSIEATLTINPELEEPVKAGVYAVDKDGKVAQVKADFNIPANTSKTTVTGIDMKDGVTNAPLADGTYTLRLISKDGEVLAETTVEKHTTEVNDAKIYGIRTFRPGRETGTVSFDVQPGESKITKAYYVAEARSDAETATDISTQGDTIRGKITTAKSPYVAVTDNKVTAATIPNLTPEKVYDIFFVLEDEYGSVSTYLCNGDKDNKNSANTEDVIYGVIPTDVATKNSVTVTKVEIPDLKDYSALSAVNITWELGEGENASGSTFVVQLYDENGIISSYEQANLTTVTMDKLTSGLTAGTYYVTVYAKGDHETFDGTPTSSNKVTVTPLNSANGIEFTTSILGESKLTWDNPYEGNSEVTTDGYSVQIAEYDQDKEDYVDYKDVDTDVDLSKADTITTPVKEGTSSGQIKVSTLYKAQVIVKATGDKLSEVDSEPTISKEFFRVATPKKVSSTDTTATLKIDPATNVKVSGKDATYKVILYKVNEADEAVEGTEKEYEEIGSQNVTVNSTTGEFTVEGLDKDTAYAIKLVGKVGDAEGTSTIVKLNRTKNSLADIDLIDKTVVSLAATSKEDTTEGQIALSADSKTIYIDGEEYTVADYPQELKNVVNIIKKLKENDVVSYSMDTPNDISIKIKTQSGDSRGFGASLKGMNVTIEGNTNAHSISTTADSQPAKVELSGPSEGQLTIGNLNADEIYVKEGTTVSTNATAQKVIVVPDSDPTTFVKFAGAYEFSASVETEISVDKTNKTAEVTATENNNLTFKGSSDVKLTINGDGTDLQGPQDGKIDITAKGDVTVAATGVNLASDITVTTEKGDVDLTGANLAGSQSVTIKADAGNTVSALAKNESNYTVKDLNIKKYTTADFATQDGNSKTIKELAGITDTDDEQAINSKLEAFNNWLNSFGLIKHDSKTGQDTTIGNAQITANKKSKEITIKFVVAGNATLEGLQK